MKYSPLCLFQVLQRPGEYIIAFPGALHSGINYGQNTAESVNFALPSTFAEMYSAFSYGTKCRYVGYLKLISGRIGLDVFKK